MCGGASDGWRSTRRFRLANWRVCMIHCAGSQKRNSATNCRGLGRADDYPLTTSRVPSTLRNFTVCFQGGSIPERFAKWNNHAASMQLITKMKGK